MVEQRECKAEKGTDPYLLCLWPWVYSDVEVWNRIPFAPDYLVSSHGRLKDKDGNITEGRWTEGYRRVKIRVGSKRQDFYMHVLMAWAFYGPPTADKPLARHLDDIRHHNHISNVQWGSHADNRADAVRNGRLARTQGAPLKRYDIDIIRELIRRADAGENRGVLQRELAMSRRHMQEIIAGRRRGALVRQICKELRAEKRAAKLRTDRTIPGPTKRSTERAG